MDQNIKCLIEKELVLLSAQIFSMMVEDHYAKVAKGKGGGGFWRTKCC